MAYLNGAGQRFANTDKEFEDEIMALTREALIKALKDENVAASLNGVDEAIDREFMDESLTGISEQEFNKEIERMFNSGEMSGLFKRMSRKLKKNAKRIRKLGVKDLTLKKLKNEAVRTVKRRVKFAKKAAPYVAAGAALYFGGPYAMAALKSAGGALFSGATKALPAVAALAKRTMPGVKPTPGSQDAMEAAKQLATIATKRAMAGKGLKMNSPRANQALENYVSGQPVFNVAMPSASGQILRDYQQPYSPTVRRANQIPAQITEQKAGIEKFVLPAAIVGGSLLLSKLV